MMDIVERLREHAPHVKDWEDGETGEPVPFSDDLEQAADEITRLRAEVEKWKTAFGAQSRKLQVALDAGGEPVREAVRAALHEDKP